MKAALAIAGANLRRTGGDRMFLLLASVMPVVLILLTGLVSGSSRVPLGLVDHGTGPAAARLVTLLERSNGVQLTPVTSRDALNDDILRGRVVAGVVIPRGFGRGGRLQLAYVEQNAEDDAQEARISVVAAVGLLAAERAAADGRRSVTPVVEASTDRAMARDHQAPVSPFSYVAAGDLVLFMGITLLVQSTVLIEARRLGLLRRMLIAPVSPWSVVAGTMGWLLVTAAGQAAGLLFLGRLAFGVHWGDPVAVLLLLTLLAFAMAGASVLVGTVARSAEHAVATSVTAGVAAGMLGGCMWSLSVVGPVMRAVGHVVPQAWAVDGLVDTVFYGSGLRGVLPDLGALAAFAVVLCTAAVWRLRRTAAS